MPDLSTCTVAVILPKYAVAIGLDEEMIKKYVWYQQKQDSGQAKLEF